METAVLDVWAKLRRVPLHALIGLAPHSPRPGANELHAIPLTAAGFYTAGLNVDVRLCCARRQ